MSQTPAHDLDRITDYVEGQLPPEAMAETERWIAEDAERRSLVAYLRQSRDAMKRSHPQSGPGLEAGTADVIRGVEARLKQSREAAIPVTMPSRIARQPHLSSHRGSRWTLGMAVGGIALILSAVAIHRSLSNAPASDVPTMSTGTRYATTTGQKAAVGLPDGSRITLAPQTTLIVARGFGTTSRVVSLEGEAVFEVSGDTRHPFVVRTATTTTKVLGTTFAVRRYPEDHGVRVAVTDGKVMVSAETVQRPSVILTAGMVGEVTDSTAQSTQAANAAQYSSWINGRLEFKKAPVSEVLTALQHWYGYQFRVNDSTLANRHLTIGISTESAQTALATLKTVWGVELVFDGTMVTVVPQRQTPEYRQPRRESLSTPRSEVGK